jgi:hypothetical protein
LDKDSKILELLEPLALDRILDRRLDKGEGLGGKEIKEQLLVRHGIDSL